MLRLTRTPVFLAVCILQAAGVTSLSQTALPLKGEITDPVSCANAAAQSYALYLPSHYTATRSWPILYALDPGARGKIPVERYQDTAEKYGWIVAGSNNSRNGSAQVSLDAWRAMWADTHERFAIDSRRTYATGFSGGARMAIYFALNCNACVAGVIASSAGFSAGTAPSSSVPFVFFGTAGVDDFNFPEVKTSVEALTKSGIANHIEVFAGRHEWPPPSLTTDAVEWLELQAMKKGSRPRDNDFIDQIWQKQLQRAQAAEASRQVYDAYQIYAGLADTFKGLRDVSEVEKRNNELRESRDVQRAVSDERAQISRQRALEREINGLIYAREKRSAESDWDNILSLLLAKAQKSAKAEADNGERRVARRVIDGLFISFMEQGRDLMQSQKRYDEAITKYQLATELAPDRPGGFVSLAAAYALKGEKKKSLQTLKLAIEKGLTDLNVITSNKAFDSIRSEPQFQQLIQNPPKTK